MDSLKSDAIRKIFGAATPQRTYEQHFGRTASERITLEEARRYVRAIAGDINLGYQGMDNIALQYNVDWDAVWPRWASYMEEWLAKKMVATGKGTVDEAYDALGSVWEEEVSLVLQWAAKQDFPKKETAKVNGIETEKGPFNFAWVSNVARQIFDGLFQGNPSAEANAAFETFLSKDLREAWRIEDNKGLDYPAETMEWLPNALYKLAGQYGATVGPMHKTGGA